jgi:hypothetical protein
MTKKVQQTEIRTVTDYPRQSSECAQVKQNYEMFPTQVEGAVGDDIIITGNNKSIESQTTNEITSQETDASQTKWAIEEIQRISLKDSDGNEYITPEIKALFSDEKNSVNMNDLVDENGKGYVNGELYKNPLSDPDVANAELYSTQGLQALFEADNMRTMAGNIF